MWSWSSAFTRWSAFYSKYWMAQVPLNLECADTNPVLVSFARWAISVLKTGVYPGRGFYSEELQRGSPGQYFADGYSMVFVATKTDHKEKRHQHLFVQNAQSLYVCDRCYAMQRGRLAYVDMSTNALHRRTVFGHLHYVRHTATRQLSPWTTIGDWCIELHRDDPQHILYQLGVASSLVASIFKLMLHEGMFGTGPYAERVETLFNDFRNSPEARRDGNLPAPFTMRKLGLHVESREPMISGTYKHGQIRLFLHYAARRFAREVDPYSPLEQQLALTCIRSLSNFVKLLDASPCMLSEQQREAALKLGIEFRNSFSILYQRSALVDDALWKCTPKFHEFDHLIERLRVERFNPLFQWACWAEETFMGITGRIRRASHASYAGLESSFLRYILWLHAEHIVPSGRG